MSRSEGDLRVLERLRVVGRMGRGKVHRFGRPDPACVSSVGARGHTRGVGLWLVDSTSVGVATTVKVPLKVAWFPIDDGRPGRH